MRERACLQARADAATIKQHAWFTAQPESPAARVPLPPEKQSVSEIQAIIERARKRRLEMLDRHKGSSNSHHHSLNSHQSSASHHSAGSHSHRHSR